MSDRMIHLVGGICFAPQQKCSNASKVTDLDLRPETKIALGLVQYTDSVDGTRKRIAVAEKYIAEFAVATECGVGRRDRETIVPL